MSSQLFDQYFKELCEYRGEDSRANFYCTLRLIAWHWIRNLSTLHMFASVLKGDSMECKDPRDCMDRFIRSISPDAELYFLGFKFVVGSELAERAHDTFANLEALRKQLVHQSHLHDELMGEYQFVQGLRDQARESAARSFLQRVRSREVMQKFTIQGLAESTLCAVHFPLTNPTCGVGGTLDANYPRAKGLKCHGCAKQAAHICERCKVASYCSAECQRAQYRAHKEHCRREQRVWGLVYNA